MGLFDVHAHLTDERLAAAEPAVLARAAAAGVTSIISNGLNPADNQKVLDLAARAPVVRPALGLYPVDAVLPEMLALGVDYHRDGAEPPPPGDACVDWLEDHIEQAFAVGEIGLDHYWVPEALWARQEALFRRLVRLAMAADKAIIIHTRKAEQRAFEVLKEEGAERVNWHCYSSKVKLGQRIAAHGHYLSIPANVGKAQNFQRLVETLPRDRILLETDCPYLAPERGQLNEPANVALTAEHAARAWGRAPACRPRPARGELHPAVRHPSLTTPSVRQGWRSISRAAWATSALQAGSWSRAAGMGNSRVPNRPGPLTRRSCSLLSRCTPTVRRSPWTKMCRPPSSRTTFLPRRRSSIAASLRRSNTAA